VTPLWAALAVYLCGYGVNATIWTERLHYLQDTDPEVAAAAHAHPTFAQTCLIIGVVGRSLVWPRYAIHSWWWRRAAGLPTR
jgi:hypothetical protein